MNHGDVKGVQYANHKKHTEAELVGWTKSISLLLLFNGAFMVLP